LAGTTKGFRGASRGFRFMVFSFFQSRFNHKLQVPRLRAASPCSRELPPVASLRRPVWTVDRVAFESSGFAFVVENAGLEPAKGCVQNIPALPRIPQDCGAAGTVTIRPSPAFQTGANPSQLQRQMAGRPCGIRTQPRHLERVVTSPEVERSPGADEENRTLMGRIDNPLLYQ
jgi:hypothetical protein